MDLVHARKPWYFYSSMEVYEEFYSFNLALSFNSVPSIEVSLLSRHFFYSVPATYTFRGIFSSQAGRRLF